MMWKSRTAESSVRGGEGWSNNDGADGVQERYVNLQKE